MTRQSDFIPNSFQTPNVYVDAYLHLLSGEEWKVLTYAIRRILGFQKRRDRISLSQFAHGITDKDGKPLDYGCNLSVDTVRKVLRNLCEFGFLVKVSDNDPTLNMGPEYELQLDDAQINMNAIVSRKSEKKKSNRDKTGTALRILRSRRMQYPLLSHNIPPPIVAQKHNNQENQGKPDSLAATLEEVELMSAKEAGKLPEIILYERVTNRFPGQYQWTLIVDFMRKNKPQEDSLSKCWDEWRKCGFRPNNLGWLDWVLNGIPERKNGNEHKTGNSKRTEDRGGERRAPAPSAADVELAEQIKAERRAKSHV